MNELKGYLEEDRRVFICRELTKAHESIEHTTIGNVDGEKLVLKGEYTLVVEGKREYSNRHPKIASVVDEKAMKCMDVLRAEGVSRTVIQRVIPECALEGGFRHSAGAVGFFLEEACFFAEFRGGAENGDFAVRFEQLLQLLDIFGQQARPAGGDNENLHVDQRMKILELILLDIDEQFGS